MLLTPSKFAAIIRNTAGTLPWKLPPESIYEARKKTSLIFQVTYVFAKYIFPAPILEGWSALIFINLMSNLKVRSRAVKHH